MEPRGEQMACSPRCQAIVRVRPVALLTSAERPRGWELCPVKVNVASQCSFAFEVACEMYYSHLTRYLDVR